MQVGSSFKIVLINPYELGRQPFALAEPAAWLKRENFDVSCIDLSLQKIDKDSLAQARLVAVYIGMHTATRIALEALPRIKALAPDAHLCFYGLYAPVNEALLTASGVKTILGGEFEPALIDLARRLKGSAPALLNGLNIHLGKIDFLVPERSGLPLLQRYAHLKLPDGSNKTVGFTEGSRGCKHWCRHCPVVPVYQGKFRVVPVDVVLADIAQQVAQGATHISFGDPDFLNGPTHSRKIVRALHHAFPEISYDATIKIQHLIEHAALLPELKATGCLFVTSAVESLDDDTLRLLEKNHTKRDFEHALTLMNEAGIALSPTFVAFTPWTTLSGYIELLRQLIDLRLVASVAPIQLAIRLLIPAGSFLLKLNNFRDLIEDFDPELLGYRWKHRDERVDKLQQAVQACVEQTEGSSFQETFEHIWRMAHAAVGKTAPSLAGVDFGMPIARLSEPWYCCAEPTTQQLQSF